MTNAPEHLYNLYLTYDVPRIGTQIGLFYTVQGDTLDRRRGPVGRQLRPEHLPEGVRHAEPERHAAARQELQAHVPGEEPDESGDPRRSTGRKYIGDDVHHTSYTQGIDFSLTLSAEFHF